MSSKGYNGITIWKSVILIKKNILKSYLQHIVLFFSDVVFLSTAYLLAFWVRFDGSLFFNSQISEYLSIMRHQIFIIIAIKVLVFYLFKMYNSMWKYASVNELIRIATSCFIANIATYFYLVLSGNALPRSIYIMTLVFDIFFVGAVRFSVRGRKLVLNYLSSERDKKRVLIIGGGQAGSQIIKELLFYSKIGKKPIAIIDDNPKKIGMNVNGVPVIGNRDDIQRIADELSIDEIIIAIPSLKRCELALIINECKKTKCKLRKLPAMHDLINGKVSINEIKEVEIEDLLGREPVKVDIESMSTYLKDQTVLVTGGGGSIGSELCRQIVTFKPKTLLILDIYENNVYNLINELIHNTSIEIKPIIASVRDEKRIDEIMRVHKPNVVFHAAAHKHVPLMEANPQEAIKNNVFGTLNVVTAADKHNVSKFILISTDKAVNPTNIMGATKRMAEMIVQTINNRSKTEFAAVRFGNVLGSNGSVIPLFKKQIAKGGPVTVTHPEVTRFFMTIPEAVQLVLQAGAMAKGGEIFVLNMGKAVKILDLAKSLIELSGFEPYEEIHIDIVGLRPGEKLYEELLMDEEGLTATSNDTIFIGKPIDIDYQVLVAQLQVLRKLVIADKETLLKHVQHIVTTYKRAG